jgi:hypothetical protein
MVLPMSIALAAMLSAVLAAGSGPEGDEVIALAGRPALRDLAAALAPPPSVVVRTTRSFGTITIDHRKHLGLRAACVRCHGPGPVSKIEFTPKVAHERCVGCHKEREAGPTACGGCHVKGATTGGAAVAQGPGTPAAGAGAAGAAVAGGAAAPSASPSTPPASPAPRLPPPPPPPPAPERAAAGAGPQAEGPAGATAQAEGPADGATAEEEPDAAPGEEARAAPGPPALPPPPPPVAPGPTGPAFVLAPPAGGAPARQQMFELGLSASPGVGPAVRISERRGFSYRAYGLERLETQGSARILALLDLGVALPLHERWGFVGTWIAGVDMQERPDLGLSVAAGLRLRVEWAPPAPWAVPLFHVSLAGIRDLGGSVGLQSEATRIVLNFGASFAIPSRPPSRR